MDGNGVLILELTFAPNEFKHDSGLVVRYTNLINFSVDVSSAQRLTDVWPDTRRLGDVQLDEILPHEKGCSHEIEMTGGTIRAVSGDLVAEWK